MCEGDAGDLQVHGAQTNFVRFQTSEVRGAFRIPRQNEKTGKKLQASDQLGVGLDLVIRFMPRMNGGEQPRELLIHVDRGGRHFISSGRKSFQKPLTQRCRITQCRQVICIKDEHGSEVALILLSSIFLAAAVHLMGEGAVA